MNSTSNTSKRIDIKSSKSWMDVTDQEYADHMRECDRVRKRIQSHKACSCTRSKFWLCDSCCDDCVFKVAGAVLSMDSPMGNDESGDEFTLHDTIADPTSEFASAVDKKIYFQQILHHLMEIYPEAITIGQLRLEGKNDSEIAETIGIPRTTFRSRLSKAKQIILREFGEDPFNM